MDVLILFPYPAAKIMDVLILFLILAYPALVYILADWLESLRSDSRVFDPPAAPKMQCVLWLESLRCDSFLNRDIHYFTATESRARNSYLI